MTFPGTSWSVACCGQFWIVPFRLLWPGGLDVWRVPRSLGRNGWTLLLLHRCDRRVEWWLLPCAWTSDLFEHQHTHFSAWGLLPVHTITSDGAPGFAGPLEHVAAAALVSSGHSDLLVASAAKATEYLLKTAADHVLNTLLLGPSHAGTSSTRTTRMRQLQQQQRCLGTKCVSEFESVSSGNAGNWLSVFLLLCCVFWCQRSDPGKVLPSLLGQGK